MLQIDVLCHKIERVPGRMYPFGFEQLDIHKGTERPKESHVSPTAQSVEQNDQCAPRSDPLKGQNQLRGGQPSGFPFPL